MAHRLTLFSKGSKQMDRVTNDFDRTIVELLTKISDLVAGLLKLPMMLIQSEINRTETKDPCHL
jgi:hypothetical protein